MFWKGRINAIIFLAIAIGIVLFCARGEYMAAGGFAVFMLFVKMCLGILDKIFTAITGKPLFYDVKVLDDE